MSPTLRRTVPVLVAAAVLAILAAVGAVRLWGDSAGDTATVGSSGASTDPAGGGASGSSGSTGSTGSPRTDASPPATPSTEPGPDDPQSRFTTVRPGRDGTSLDVTFWGGVDTCYRYTVSADEDADGSMAADDRGAGEAPEQPLPRPLQSGRRHDTAPIPRTRPGRSSDEA